MHLFKNYMTQRLIILITVLIPSAIDTNAYRYNIKIFEDSNQLVRMIKS